MQSTAGRFTAPEVHLRPWVEKDPFPLR